MLREVKYSHQSNGFQYKLNFLNNLNILNYQASIKL